VIITWVAWWAVPLALVAGYTLPKLIRWAIRDLGVEDLAGPRRFVAFALAGAGIGIVLWFLWLVVWVALGPPVAPA